MADNTLNLGVLWNVSSLRVQKSMLINAPGRPHSISEKWGETKTIFCRQSTVLLLYFQQFEWRDDDHKRRCIISTSDPASTLLSSHTRCLSLPSHTQTDDTDTKTEQRRRRTIGRRLLLCFAQFGGFIAASGVFTHAKRICEFHSTVYHMGV